MIRRSIFSILLVLVLVALLPAHLAAASQPLEVTGTFAIIEQTLVDMQNVDGNIILTLDEVITVSGGFEGTLEITERFVFNHNGGFTAHSKGTYTGTLLGSSEGMGIYSTTASGEWTMIEGSPVPTVYNGKNSFRGTSGGLVGMNGHGSFDPSNYTAYVHLAP